MTDDADSFARLRRLHGAYGLLACAGSVVIGVTLPVLLVAWYVQFRSLDSLMSAEVLVKPTLPGIQLILTNLYYLEGTALILCGPPAFALAGGLYLWQRDMAEDRCTNFHKFQLKGAAIGAALALLNIPGWYAASLLEAGTFSEQRHWVLPMLGVLFAVAGSSCGLWITWQAWRYHHPECGVIPRYSLKTMMVLIFMWGGLMALFKPHG